jgi:hypothetical protein
VRTTILHVHCTKHCVHRTKFVIDLIRLAIMVRGESNVLQHEFPAFFPVQELGSTQHRNQPVISCHIHFYPFLSVSRSESLKRVKSCSAYEPTQAPGAPHRSLPGNVVCCTSNGCVPSRLRECRLSTDFPTPMVKLFSTDCASDTTIRCAHSRSFHCAKGSRFS